MARSLPILCLLFVGVGDSHAGMTVYDLNDVVRLRLQDVSFFTVLFLVCALGVRFLWNYLAKDFAGLPRLTYGKSLCLTGLLSLGMLLVLSMISGARELLTPGAWRKQGHEYRLNEASSEPRRRQSLESLRSALFMYAQAHGGRFPLHDYVPEIHEKSWESPDANGTRYLYIGGMTSGSSTNIIACEPLLFGDERFVLFADGNIQKLTTRQIREAVGVREGR